MAEGSSLRKTARNCEAGHHRVCVLRWAVAVEVSRVRERARNFGAEPAVRSLLVRSLLVQSLLVQSLLVQSLLVQSLLVQSLLVPPLLVPPLLVLSLLNRLYRHHPDRLGDQRVEHHQALLRGRYASRLPVVVVEHPRAVGSRQGFYPEGMKI